MTDKQRIERWVVLGKLASAYGVHGWLRVRAYADDPKLWQALSSCWIKPGDGSPDTEKTTQATRPPKSWREVRVLSTRWQKSKKAGDKAGNGFLAQLAGITDRDAALALKGFLIMVPLSALPPPAKDEYYWADLVGLKVTNQASVVLGVVDKLIETGTHPVLQVVEQDSRRERLLPFMEDVISIVNVEHGFIRVNWEVDW